MRPGISGAHGNQAPRLITTANISWHHTCIPVLAYAIYLPSGLYSEPSLRTLKPGRNLSLELQGSCYQSLVIKICLRFLVFLINWSWLKQKWKTDSGTVRFIASTSLSPWKQMKDWRKKPMWGCVCCHQVAKSCNDLFYNREKVELYLLEQTAR